MTDKLYLVTPPGRIIMGDLSNKNTTDHNNRPLPENKHHFFIGLAIPKTDPNIGAFLGQVQQYAYGAYSQHPHIQAQVQQGLAAQFAWKIDDGDSPDFKNQHGKGCFVIKMSTTLPIRACDNQNQQIDAAMIKRGYWADVAVSIAPNGQTDNTAGIYINPQTVRLLGYDQEIQSGPSIEQQFANAPAALPQGASATPVASSGMPGSAMGNAGTDMTGQNGQVNQSANAGGGMPPNGMGNAGIAGDQMGNQMSGMNNVNMQTPPNGQNAQAGGAMPGMDTGAASQAQGTAYGGVNPHTGILNGPGAGQAQGGMPGAGGMGGM